MVAVSACCAVSLPSAACTTSCSSRVSPVFRIQFWPGRRQWSCGIYLSKGRAVEEVAENKELKDEGHVLRRVAVLASDMGVDKEGVQSRSFLNVQAGEELLTCIRNGLGSGNIPPNIAVGMEELYRNYRNAVLQSGSPLADKIILSNMSVALDRILLDAEDPFTFPPHHKAVQQPFDYYMFGLNYFRPLIDFRRSYVGNIHILNEIEEKLHQGHNIILIANHQTEADPAIISLLLESTNPYIAKETTYVAGDRVVTDPLCKPFSMGRNLLCVYSKRHLYDTPELAEMKMRANTRSLKAMALLLRATGQIIWIAPSGGRDRPDPVTGEWYPAPFDASSIDNMRRLADHSGVPGHIYPFSLLCYDVMPPPPQVEKKIGECRKISFHGVGLSVCPEVHFDKFLGDSENPEKAKVAFSQALYDSVTGQYKVLKSVVYGHKGLDASNSIVSLSQPWQ